MRRSALRLFLPTRFLLICASFASVLGATGAPELSLDQPSPAAPAPDSAPPAPAPLEVYLRSAPPPLTPAAGQAYTLGWRMAGSFREKRLRLSPQVFVASFFAGLRGEAALVPAEELLFAQGVIHRQAAEDTKDFPKRPSLPEKLSLGPVTSLALPGAASAHILAHVEAAPFRALGLPVDAQGFASGVIDGYLGDPPQLPAEDFDRLSAAWEARVLARQAEQNSAAAAAGEAYVAAYRARHPEAIALERGVTYRLQTRGEGAFADGNDVVQVRYVARRLDGSVFEDTPALTPDPVEIPVPALFPGLRQVLLHVPVGSILSAIIPGPEGTGSAWSAEQPGNTTLIYELEYLGLKTYPGEVP